MNSTASRASLARGFRHAQASARSTPRLHARDQELSPHPSPPTRLPQPPPSLSPLPCLVQRALLIIRVSARYLRARGCASAGAGRRRNAREVCTRRVHTQRTRSLRANGTRRWWNACGCMSWMRCLPYAGVVVLVPVAERAVEAGIRVQRLCASGTWSSTRAEVVIRLVHDGSS